MNKEELERFERMEREVKYINEALRILLASDRYTIQKTLQLFDGRNIQTGISTGTKFGTATGQKLAFHNSTPVIQRAGSGGNQDAASTTSATQTTPWGYASSVQANSIITLLNEIRATLVEKGIMKGSNA